MDAFLVVKWVHILSATLLFGTGLGTAFHMWLAHRSGDATHIAHAARQTVLADWLFTLPSGIVQPVSGIALIYLVGYDPHEGWLMLAYALYFVAGACWIVVALLQIRIARWLSEGRSPKDAQYQRAMRLWFALGWPAFLTLIIVFWLMVARPGLS